MQCDFSASIIKERNICLKQTNMSPILIFKGKAAVDKWKK